MSKFYCILHKASGEIMPTMKNGRGYTYWNPGSELWDGSISTNTPRLFDTAKRAKGAVARWAGYKLKMCAPLEVGFGHAWVPAPEHVPRKSSELEVVLADIEIFHGPV